MDNQQDERTEKTGENGSEIEFYDPFARKFVSRKRKDPILRLYDEKVVNDDF